MDVMLILGSEAGGWATPLLSPDARPEAKCRGI